MRFLTYAFYWIVSLLPLIAAFATMSYFWPALPVFWFIATGLVHGIATSVIWGLGLGDFLCDYLSGKKRTRTEFKRL